MPNEPHSLPAADSDKHHWTDPNNGSDYCAVCGWAPGFHPPKPLPRPEPTSEEVRALITVMWGIATKLDRVLAIFDKQPGDPRYNSDLYRPR